MIVFPLMPDIKFEKRQEIAENARNTQLIIVEIKKNVTNEIEGASGEDKNKKD